MRKPLLLLFILAFVLAPPVLGQDKTRYPIAGDSLTVKDIETRHSITIPGDQGYFYEIIEGGDRFSKIKLFDREGLEVQGVFQVSSWTVSEALKAEIEAGLKAAKKGAAAEQPGCCDVSGEEKSASAPVRSPDDPVRSPAIAPGTSIVYSEPFAQPQAEEEQRTELEARIEVNPSPQPQPQPAAQAPPPQPSPQQVTEPKKPELVAVPIPRPRPEQKPKPAATALSSSTPVEKVPIPVARPEHRPSSQSRRKPRSPASRGPLCRAFDAFRSQGVPEAPLRQTLLYFLKAQKEGKVSSKSRYLALADYSQHSSKKRFYLLDLKTLSVTAEKVSHGGGTRRSGYRGDPDHNGMLNRCAQTDGMTRAGFFRVGDYYFSQSGRYKWPLVTRRPPRNGLRMHGLSNGVNNEALSDGVVMHEAKYNPGGNAPMGRSHGCPAFVPGKGAPIMEKLARGSLYYSYAPVCRDYMEKVYKQVRGWQDFCK